jgi:hypothetical protein
VIRTVSDAGARVVAAARERLAAQCSYAFYFRDVKMHFSDGILTLRGRVPTYYLKQLVQSRLQELPDVLELHNRVDVVSSRGVSSAPQSDMLKD